MISKMGAYKTTSEKRSLGHHRSRGAQRWPEAKRRKDSSSVQRKADILNPVRRKATGLIPADLNSVQRKAAVLGKVLRRKAVHLMMSTR